MIDPIREAVEAAVRERARRMEEMCERSLTDPLGRGVLVHERTDLDAFSSYETVELSRLVPFGEIHTHKTLGPECSACGAQVG